LAIHDAAAKKVEQGVKTGALNRLSFLEENLLQEPIAELPDQSEIRYQLLTGTAAALALAKSHHAPISVFVIHEFRFAGHVDERKLRQNTMDLDRFVSRLTRNSSILYERILCWVRYPRRLRKATGAKSPSILER
jgi:hypothetical protein